MNNTNNFKIIGINSNSIYNNKLLGKNIIGKYLYNNNFEVHLLKISDEINFNYYAKNNFCIKEIISNKLLKEYEVIWNNGFYKTLEKIFNNKCSIIDIFKFLYMCIKKTIFPTIKYSNKDYSPQIISNIFYSQFNKNYINFFVDKYNKNIININNQIWSELLYLRMLSIIENSYSELNKIIFIIYDIQNIPDINFIKSIGGKIINISQNINNTNENKYDIILNSNDLCYNANNILISLFPNDNDILNTNMNYNINNTLINNEIKNIIEEDDNNINKNNIINLDITIDNSNDINNEIDTCGDDDKDYLKIENLKNDNNSLLNKINYKNIEKCYNNVLHFIKLN
jgi:hypothetical protein